MLSTSWRSSSGWSCRSTSAPIEAKKERKIADVAIQPGSRPGRTRQPSEITSVPASGKASTSQP
jgi:hypothetical protein